MVSKAVIAVIIIICVIVVALAIVLPIVIPRNIEGQLYLSSTDDNDYGKVKITYDISRKIKKMSGSNEAFKEAQQSEKDMDKEEVLEMYKLFTLRKGKEFYVLKDKKVSKPIKESLSFEVTLPNNMGVFDQGVKRCFVAKSGDLCIIGFDEMETDVESGNEVVANTYMFNNQPVVIDDNNEETEDLTTYQIGQMLSQFITFLNTQDTGYTFTFTTSEENNTWSISWTSSA